jgi:hypothetical protein
MADQEQCPEGYACNHCFAAPQLCPRGYYSAAGATTCTLCEAGYKCPMPYASWIPPALLASTLLRVP